MPSQGSSRRTCRCRRQRRLSQSASWQGWLPLEKTSWEERHRPSSQAAFLAGLCSSPSASLRSPAGESSLIDHHHREGPSATWCAQNSGGAESSVQAAEQCSSSVRAQRVEGELAALLPGSNWRCLARLAQPSPTAASLARAHRWKFVSVGQRSPRGCIRRPRAAKHGQSWLESRAFRLAPMHRVSCPWKGKRRTHGGDATPAGCQSQGRRAAEVASPPSAEGESRRQSSRGAR